MCVASENCQLRERVEQIDARVTRLEENMASGFQTVTSAVNQLATDFGARMNTLDAKIVEEKAKWGDAFRKWLDWGIKVALLGCLAAMGLTAYKIIFGVG